jgi:small GTP-binding protein
MEPWRREEQNHPKLIVIGDAGVGKTCIINQFHSREFTNNVECTVKAYLVAENVQTPSGQVSMCIWDTAGQERYRSTVGLYTRNSSAALLVFDVTSLESFESRDYWYELLLTTCPNAKIYVAVNKIDLHPVIPVADIESWADSHSFPVFKTSARNYPSVEAVFVRIAEDMLKAGLKALEPEQQLDQTSPEKARCC